MKPDLDKQDKTTTDSATRNPAHRSLDRKAGWALFWNIVFLPVKALLGLVVSLVIIQIFVREAYTALAAVTSLLTLLGVVTDLGIERALPRFVGEIEITYGRTFLRRFVFTITIVKLVILAAVSLFFATFADTVAYDWFKLGEHGREYLALICVLLVLGAIYDIATQVLYSFFKQKVTNLLDIVVTVLNPVLTLIFILVFQWEVFGVIQALVLTTIISVIIATWQAWTASHEVHEPAPVVAKHHEEAGAADAGANPGLTEKIKLRWRFVKYAALMYFFNISASLYDSAFVIVVLVYFKEMVAAAVIKIVYSFIKTLLKNLLTPFNGVQTPLFSSIYAQGNPKSLQIAYASLSKLQSFILVPSAFGVIILSRNLLELLMLRHNTDAVLTPDLLPTATWATILTVLFTFSEALIGLPMVVLMVYEKYRSVIISRLLPFLTVPLIALVAFFNLGAVAAVVVMGVLAVGSRLMALVFARRMFGLLYPVKFLWKVLKATLAFAIPLQIAILLLPVNWPVTIGAAVIGVAIFGLVFKKLGGFDPDDKKRLQSIKLPFRNLVIKYL